MDEFYEAALGIVEGARDTGMNEHLFYRQMIRPKRRKKRTSKNIKHPER